MAVSKKWWTADKPPGITQGNCYHFMRVLLYDRQSGRYFRPPAGWTQDHRQAVDFKGTVRAVNAAYQNRLKSVDVILAFDDAHLRNMYLPLDLEA